MPHSPFAFTTLPVCFETRDTERWKTIDRETGKSEQSNPSPATPRPLAIGGDRFALRRHVRKKFRETSVLRLHSTRRKNETNFAFAGVAVDRSFANGEQHRRTGRFGLACQEIFDVQIASGLAENPFLFRALTPAIDRRTAPAVVAASA